MKWPETSRNHLKRPKTSRNQPFPPETGRNETFPHWNKRKQAIAAQNRFIWSLIMGIISYSDLKWLPRWFHPRCQRSMIARHRRRASLVPPARNCGWDSIGRSRESKLWRHRRIPLLRPVWRDLGYPLFVAIVICQVTSRAFVYYELGASWDWTGIIWLVKTGLSPKVSYVRFFDHPIRFRFDRALSQKRIMACITQQRDQDLQVVWHPEK